jgi:hypothetical protein
LASYLSLSIHSAYQTTHTNFLKPGCLRCAKSGWHCDGYAPVPNSSTNSSQRASSSSPALSLYSPSVALDLDKEERMYFQIYAENTSTSLDGRWWYSDHTVKFKTILLQECHANQCVRHIIVAQGALSQSFHTKTHYAYIRKINSPRDTHHEYALTQYQKALRGLRTAIDGHQSGAGARETLISCFALSMFDFFCGNGGFATQHSKHLPESILLFL